MRGKASLRRAASSITDTSRADRPECSYTQARLRRSAPAAAPALGGCAAPLRSAAPCSSDWIAECCVVLRVVQGRLQISVPSLARLHRRFEFPSLFFGGTCALPSAAACVGFFAALLDAKTLTPIPPATSTNAMIPMVTCSFFMLILRDCRQRCFVRLLSGHRPSRAWRSASRVPFDFPCRMASTRATSSLARFSVRRRSSSSRSRRALRRFRAPPAPQPAASCSTFVAALSASSSRIRSSSGS